MSTTPAETLPTEVPKGRFMGFDEAELDESLANYKLAVKKHEKMRIAAAGGTLQFTGINGKQMTYNMADVSEALEEWRVDLEDARNQLAGLCVAHTNAAVGRFSGAVSAA